MAELLLELFSEEIPARMQAHAAAHLAEAMEAALKKHGLSYEELRTEVTPRRLVLMVTGLPVVQEARLEERRGPKLGAPDAAVQGFLKSAGVASAAELEQRDGYYFAVMKKGGMRTELCLAGEITNILEKFPWKKSMRWGNYETRWVRPLKNILCLFNGEAVPLVFGHLTANDATFGHRFLAKGAVTVRSIAEYEAALKARFVMLDAGARRAAILEQARAAATALGGRLNEDEALLEEVAGLVEWPVVLSGAFDKEFLALPKEVLVTAMRAHQKYFTVEDAKGVLLPGFVFVSNMETADKGAKIIAGNERVLRARLSDARFFWDQDRHTPLKEWAKKLSGVVFHAKLGTMADKAARLEGLAKFLAVWVPRAGLPEVEKAARLCKADLTTGMVGEFPELQGLMGRYYALEQGEDAALAEAIRDHYAPAGAVAVGDAQNGHKSECPSAPVSVALALADRMDTLAGMFAIDEKPTGSKDPYALRRAALGVIRLIVGNRLRVPLRLLIDRALLGYPPALFKEADEEGRKKSKRRAALAEELFAFIVERLKVMMRDEGFSHDQIAAVFAGGEEDDLTRAMMRVRSLRGFLATVEGGNLLEAYRRAANILRAEEKKDDTAYRGKSDVALLKLPEEVTLLESIKEIRVDLPKLLKEERFDDACRRLAALREPVGAFFDRVTVNDSDPALRKNRLLLLSGIRVCMDMVVDFSALEG